MRVGSLCTGYGGIELGLAAAGETVDVRWIAEVDPALAPLHGEVRNLGDVKAVDWSSSYLGGIDFAEWLMCLPAGHVTSKLTRIPALRAIGNGVCPPQLAAAWRLLTGESA